MIYVYFTQFNEAHDKLIKFIAFKGISNTFVGNSKPLIAGGQINSMCDLAGYH